MCYEKFHEIPKKALAPEFLFYRAPPDVYFWAVLIVPKGKLANETVNYDIEIKAHQF